MSYSSMDLAIVICMQAMACSVISHAENIMPLNPYSIKYGDIFTFFEYYSVSKNEN